MKSYYTHIYSFPNASLTLRVIEHLRNSCQSTLNSVAVINLLDCWMVKVILKPSIGDRSAKNLQAFFNEMGVVYKPSAKVVAVLTGLEAGESPTVIMNRYQVVIVAYGKPEIEEIEIFRDRVVERLGYCPQNMM